MMIFNTNDVSVDITSCLTHSKNHHPETSCMVPKLQLRCISSEAQGTFANDAIDLRKALEGPVKMYCHVLSCSHDEQLSNGHVESKPDQ